MDTAVLTAARKQLIFALDVPDRKEAARFARELKGRVGCFKVGLELFIKEGPGVLKAVSGEADADIFLDLKLHDIPATVQNALRSASALGARYITVHASGGKSMLEMSRRAVDEGLEVLAVTVLTSMSPADLQDQGYPSETTISDLVCRRAELAQSAGCAGIVCSGEEAAMVRKRCGANFKIVTPGIRPTWSLVEGDDQSRIVTPGQAVERGADMIVVGRPIRSADDPGEAADRIVRELAGFDTD